MTFEEYKQSTLKTNNKRKTETYINFGLYNSYCWCKKHYGLDVDYTVFRQVVKELGKGYKAELLKGLDIILPVHMGRIELCKYPSYYTRKEGKLKTNLPIDWQTTLLLWYDDPEAKENKILVRHEAPFQIKIGYNKQKAKYKNKSYFEFKASRTLKRELAGKMKNNELDAFLFKT